MMMNSCNIDIDSITGSQSLLTKMFSTVIKLLGSLTIFLIMLTSTSSSSMMFISTLVCLINAGIYSQSFYSKKTTVSKNRNFSEKMVQLRGAKKKWSKMLKNWLREKKLPKLEVSKKNGEKEFNCLL